MVTKNYYQNEARMFCIQLNSIISIFTTFFAIISPPTFSGFRRSNKLTTINILSDGAIEFHVRDINKNRNQVRNIFVHTNGTIFFVRCYISSSIKWLRFSNCQKNCLLYKNKNINLNKKYDYWYFSSLSIKQLYNELNR